MRLVRHELFLRPASYRLRQRARVHARRRDWEQAKKCYEELLVRVAHSPAIWMQYGHVCKEAGDPTVAEHAYRTAALLVPRATEPHWHLGVLLRTLNRSSESLEAFLRGAAADPRSSDLVSELRRDGLSNSEIAAMSALSALELGALTKTERRLLTAPSIRRLLVNMALPLVQAAAKRHRWSVARKGYEQLQRIDPSNASLSIQLGHSHKELGDLVEAQIAYREAVAWNPWHADAYLHLGHVAKLSGDTEAARAWYLHAWQLAPNTAGLRQELSALGIAQNLEAFRQVWLSSIDVGLRKYLPSSVDGGQSGRAFGRCESAPDGMSLSARSLWSSMVRISNKRI
ncbi:tetratricopeptide repeat protein (plasmid) [Ensifer adhaerens]